MSTSSVVASPRVIGVHEDEELCVLEIAVDRCLGPESGWGRIGFEPTASVHH